MTISNLDALIILDVQNDLCRGGPMGVRSGEVVAGRMTIAAKAFAQRGAKVFATQDWHPADHPSFVSQGGQWPDHCVEDSPGAAFHPCPRTAARSGHRAQRRQARRLFRVRRLRSR